MKIDLHQCPDFIDDIAVHLAAITEGDGGREWLLITGFELLKLVRADPKTKSLPFVLVTAEAKIENVIAARQAGVNSYIIKPFNHAVLKQKLTAVLGEF
jgi:CheY-like chemotaxis protein